MDKLSSTSQGKIWRGEAVCGRESVPLLHILLHFSMVFLFLGLSGAESEAASLIEALALDGAFSQVGGVRLIVGLSADTAVASLRAVGANTRVFSFFL